jgi:hypothetical protein
MCREVTIVRVDAWLIPARLRHAGTQLVRNDLPRHSPEERDALASHPIGQALAPRCLGRPLTCPTVGQRGFFKVALRIS